MLPIVITIPNYIREVKLSESQRAKYWEWDGINITCKGKPLLQKYIDPNCRDQIILNNGKVHPSHLRKEYKIAVILGNKIICKIYDTIYLAEPELIKDVLCVTERITKAQSEKLKFYLCNEDNQLVIQNADKVGTPRILRIKGQDIYSGNVREHTRAKLMLDIKNSYLPYIKHLKPITEYPIAITLYLYTTIKLLHDRHKDELGQRWDIDNHAFPYLKAFPDVLMEQGIIEDDDRLHITIPPHAVFCPVEKDEDRKLVFEITQDTRPMILNNPAYNRKTSFETGKRLN